MLIPTTTTTWGIFLAGCSPLSSMPNNGVKTEVSQFERRCLEPLLLFLSVCATEIEGRNEGLAKRLEAIFDEISVGLKSGQGIPGNLNVEEQCQFFSGYRLQRIDLNLPY